MPKFAQRLVSKQKRRLTRDEFDLDMSYIWPAPNLETGLPPAGEPARLLTMGFPASGKEGMYRNPMEEVKRFLHKYHGPDHFKVFNFCAERCYETHHF
eukprot:SAG31_NODE_24735_length_475_cov_0.821809_1_plen_97_part_01